MSEQRIVVREPDQTDRAWLEQQLGATWGSTTIVSRGQAHDVSRAPSLVALQRGDRVGIVTFRFEHEQCELLTLDAFRKREGIASALLAGVTRHALEHGCRRLWLITTNDNLDAMRFYQRRGMRLVAVHSGAVDEARRIKPAIPEVGEYGIALHDELEFELLLAKQ
jgi:ribosomal protein S18 acetylase RimI-like enzyme